MYQYKVNKTTITTDRALYGHESTKAGVVNCDNGYLLMSYATPVAFVSFDGEARCMNLCSATTRKHVSIFAREFNKTYADFKEAYIKG